ncbi:MAG: hypothetical protein K2K26_01185, partial [Muribaculaceae bacterium]|nr:hypothetical protein [Muribaculaceae bacterium]
SQVYKTLPLQIFISLLPLPSLSTMTATPTPRKDLSMSPREAVQFTGKACAQRPAQTMYNF